MLDDVLKSDGIKNDLRDANADKPEDKVRCPARHEEKFAQKTV